MICSIWRISLSHRILGHSSLQTEVEVEEKEIIDIQPERHLRGNFTCPIDTGATCNVMECASWRGNATCSSNRDNSSRRCVCRSGCADQHGVCGSEPNAQVVASRFRLRSARRESIYMVADNGSVSGDIGTGTSFQLLRSSSNGGTYFLLAGTELVAIEEYEHCQMHTQCDPWGCEQFKQCELRYRPQAFNIENPVSPETNLFAVKLWTVSGMPDALVIQSLQHTSYFIEDDCIAIEASTKRGPGSYWIVEPPLNLSDLPILPSSKKLSDWKCAGNCSCMLENQMEQVVWRDYALSIFCVCTLLVFAASRKHGQL